MMPINGKNKKVHVKNLALKGEGRREYSIMALPSFGIGHCITFSLSGENKPSIESLDSFPLLSSLCVWTGWVPEGCHPKAQSENRFPGQ